MVAPAEDSWRGELAARLQRYRTRRKPQSPRYPSLLLPFDSPEGRFRSGSISNTGGNRNAEAGSPGTEELARRPEPLDPTPRLPFASDLEIREAEPNFNARQIAATADNLLEFPRSAAIPVFLANELADPVVDRPRIVEAPEVLPPPPALGGMLMEAISSAASRRRSDDNVLRARATVLRRALAALADALVVGCSVAAFAALFLRVNHFSASLALFAGVLGSVGLVLWMTYEFLFLVYTGSTPGLRAARLQLARFDGRPLSRSLRRWRVLTSFLSAFAAGLGYIWSLLDEDGMCWHDRITRTYLQLSPKSEVGGRDGVIRNAAAK